MHSIFKLRFNISNNTIYISFSNILSFFFSFIGFWSNITIKISKEALTNFSILVVAISRLPIFRISSIIKQTIHIASIRINIRNYGNKLHRRRWNIFRYIIQKYIVIFTIFGFVMIINDIICPYLKYHYFRLLLKVICFL